LMAIGTMSIAFMPGYAAIGIIAPLLVLVGRLLQGLSAGAEVGGVSVYLSEIATPNRKGFYVSWQSASQQAAVIFAALVGLALTSYLTKGQIQAGGWRIPLLLGCLLLPFIFLLRRSLEETKAFTLRPKVPFADVMASMATHWRIVLLGTMIATMTTVSFYLITAYTPTFGSVVLHLDARDNLVVTLCVGITNFLLLPTMGALSDRVGRRPLLITASVLALVTGYPALSWLVAEPSFQRLLLVELWLACVYSAYNGAMVVYLTEIMPPDVRAAGFSLAYSAATAIFGGFTPAICTYLIHVTGNSAMPGAWLSAAALIGLAATMMLSPRRADARASTVQAAL
jgi:MFS family permease